MKFPGWLPVYGDADYRAKKPRVEECEQIDIFNWLQHNHPEDYAIAIHPKNEGKRSGHQAARDRSSGCLNKGASDVIIPAALPLVCEVKRADHTKSAWQPGQLEFLHAAHDAGAFVFVAIGFEGFKIGHEAWKNEQRKNNTGRNR